jgi:NAD(P)-dependent dehydrogenase (short-subunit alcohol dehydrogenase family)
VQALAGAALGVFAAAAYFVPNLEAWGVFFAAAVLLIPSAAMPAVGVMKNTMSGGTMRDRVAIITGVGGTGQLGYAIARAFADAGARLVLVGLTDDIRSTATQLGPRDRVVGVRANLTSADEVDSVIAAARTFGRVDALVNVAGGLTVTGTIEGTSGDQFRREMSINAETALLMSKAALPLLRESRGAVVNFASAAGQAAIAGLGAYSAAKAAVIAITRSLALEEVQNGVRVNAVAPGLVDTDQNRASSPEGTPFVSREQIADVVLFLCSDAAAGITGETIQVPGPTLS